MLREAFQYIVDLGNTRIEEVDGRKFSTQPIYPITEPVIKTINVTSLSGFVDYVKSKFDYQDALMVHVVSPTRVVAFTQVNNDFKRSFLIEAEAFIPGFTYERFYDAETFNIKLQSGFVNNEDKKIMLKVVGNIKEENVKSYGDDGVSQMVTAKAGTTTVANVVVPNPVTLKPYRTFVEVEQPESDFVFRMQSGPRCALFEADGGAWELQAMQNVKEYLQTALEEELINGKVLIIA